MFLALAAVTVPELARGQATASTRNASRQVFNDVFLGQPAPPGFVVLSAGLVYRVEVEPAAAQLSVRVARRTSLPPLMLVPLSDASRSSGGAAFLLVPRRSDEYRLDVASLGDEPVRVRIFVDSAENARWERMREDSRGQAPAGISVRAVYIGAFPSAGRFVVDSTAAAGGLGVEACFAVLPHGAWIRQAYIGCVISLTLVRRAAADGDAVFLSTSPRLELTGPGSATKTALSLQLGTGWSRSSDGFQINLFLLGASVLTSVPVPGTQGHFFAEGELGVSSISGSTNSRDVRSCFAPKLGVGLQYVF